MQNLLQGNALQPPFAGQALLTLLFFVHFALEPFCKSLSISSQPEGGELPTGGEEDSRPGENFFFDQCENLGFLSKSE